MKINEQPRVGSYEAALTQDQRISLQKLLLSDASLIEIWDKAPLWPQGPEQGRKPSKMCLCRMQRRLLMEKQARGMETAEAVFRISRPFLQKLTDKNDQSKMMDHLTSLISRQVINSSTGPDNSMSKAVAYRLLLQREKLRLYAERTAKMEQANKKDAPPPSPILSDEEKERRWRAIFGMEPLSKTPAEGVDLANYDPYKDPQLMPNPDPDSDPDTETLS
jgi:hypothetical protein